MVFVYQTGRKIPKEIVRNKLIYHHEWNAKSMAEAKRVAKSRGQYGHPKVYIKKIQYARETVYAIYFHFSTSDRLIDGRRYENMAGAPTKQIAKRLAKDIYESGYRVIKTTPGYSVLVPVDRLGTRFGKRRKK
jgi:hypothetical protein